MNKIRIYIADDHALLRDGLKLILSQNEEFEVVGEADNGKTALEEIEKLKPDVALLDVSMPIMSGLETARQLKKYNPKIKLIMLSRHDNIAYVQQALQNNINGYILKDYAGNELLRALAEVIAGNVYLSPKLIKSLTSRMFLSKKEILEKISIEEDLLTDREKQVLKLICEGKHNKETAAILRIAVKTVEVHRQNIMKKLDVHNVTDLIKYGIKSGLIEI